MFGNDRDEETICAVSTPPGRGGVAVVRISGAKALSLVQFIAPFLSPRIESHRLYYGTLVDPDSNEPIDEVLVSFFEAGRSYTGQETVEISCHGNPSITSEVLRLLIQAGAKHAGPGEFTYRAFINGKIDLVQAENVLSLIEGKTEKQRKVALRNLKGELSKAVAKIEDSLISVLAQLEASIDFTEEDIDLFETNSLIKVLDGADIELRSLVESFSGGRLLSEGVEVAILGPTNAGKSSLLNQLVKEERAIVTDIPGTTRDVVTAEFVVNGCLVRFSDTAGLRETNDEVERIGIGRSLKAAESADFIFYVNDARDIVAPQDREVIADMAKRVPVVVLANKIDLLPNGSTESPCLESLNDEVDWLYGTSSGSVKTGELGSVALEWLGKYLASEVDVDTSLVTRPRQYELLNEACVSLREGRRILQEGLSADLIASELKHALMSVQEVAGKRFEDDILDRIFKEFCIGK